MAARAIKSVTPWPDDLLRYDPGRWSSRRAWLHACWAFAYDNNYRTMGLVQAVNQRLEINEVPAMCREQVRRKNG